ncbi:putative protein [Zhongshania aliphaticivorans]|uniref:DUF58 domain-containing protein n=1 Tax=Zhongshania aliphaticivorans TaxID=1470434 RepID=A0A5S9PYK9_9GAMM|nr:DUF58 domain-containing protein [Zhongshania aliphaticivorans]CAA0109790.1 putative protein [Zhongshania aliphaticivorans]CAA0117908.1 putative protein [Zhongshania aliphaticivorans]CAA0121663.1 putative protein [Zhongshania aliphaticivorans]
MSKPLRSDFSAPVKGAVVDQQSLIHTRFAASKLKATPRRRHFAKQGGNHASPFKGRGLAFHHVREYQGGDEIRHIDWRVTARTAKAHTKIFEEEKERPVVLCLDQRASMFFGSQHCFKSVLACHVAATLAWAGLENNDRVGGLVFADEHHREVRPRRSHKAVLNFIHTAADYNQGLTQSKETPETNNAQSLATAFEELRRITRPGSTVYVLSDFAGYGPDAERQLHLIARHNDVIAISHSDPMEENLPANGNYPVSNGRERLQLSLTNALREQFLNRHQREQHNLQASLKRGGIHHIALSTDSAYFLTLQRGMGQI